MKWCSVNSMEKETVLSSFSELSVPNSTFAKFSGFSDQKKKLEYLFFEQSQFSVSIKH